MVRIDARTAEGAIDWNANGIDPDGSYADCLDINFNGRIPRCPVPSTVPTTGPASS